MCGFISEFLDFILHFLCSACVCLLYEALFFLLLGVALYSCKIGFTEDKGFKFSDRILLFFSRLLLLIPICLFVFFIYFYFAYDFNLFYELFLKG